MAAAPSNDPHRRTLERIKELDHEHRRRVRSSWQSGTGMAMQLRYLRSALRRLVTPVHRNAARTVPHPAPGQMAVTFVGHATVMLTTASTRLLTDPLFSDSLYLLRRAESACLADEDAQDVSLVLISHAHRDHLHPASLARLSRAATIVVPPRCAPLVEKLGFTEVLELSPGDTHAAGDVTVTAVAARHDGRRGLGDPTWRGAGGYVVRAGGAAPAVSAYFAGDTAYFSGFAEIGQRLRPDVALLPIAGYEPLALRDGHMSPLDAFFAFEDLGAELLIPIAHGSFPLGYEPLAEPLAWLSALCAEKGMTDRLAPLRHGETCLVRGRAAPMDAPASLG